MKIDAQLTKEQFTRLSILYHIQRKQFYFYAFTAAVITAYAIIQTNYTLLVVVWLPFLLYIGIGIYGAVKEGRNENNPAFLPTTYLFSEQGVLVKTSRGESRLLWGHFSGWQVVAKNYILKLKSGAILAIPQSAVKSTQWPRLKALLDKHIK